MKKFLTTLLLSLLSLMSFSQAYDQKFGKVSMAEMEMKVCPIDSSAEAVMLFDLGETKFEYNTTKNHFQLKILRHARIKILSKDGLDLAYLNLVLYNENESQEKLSSFKGVTFNLQNGKIVKEKVEKDAIFKEKKDEIRTGIKIAFPKVVEGSIIEFDYEITSDYVFSLQPWTFQYSIPVLYSKYSVGIPEYYHYNTHLSGYENVVVTNDEREESVVFVSSERSGGNSLSDGAVRTQISRDQVKYIEYERTFIGQNLPALENEAYVDNIENYITKVDFEIAWVRFPGSTQRNYTKSWDEITDKLLDDPDFGKQIDKGNYLSDELKTYLGATEKPEEKILKTLSFIKSKIKWNDVYRLFSENGVKAAYKKGEGSSSDINLNLIVALRELGFEAYPIILSTRSHGIIKDWQVTVTGFNHVIAGVKVGENLYYCDATSSLDILGLLPTECLNGKGRLIDLKKSSWVDLTPKNISRKSVYATYSFVDNVGLTGTFDVLYKDYFALKIAQTIKGDDSLKNYKQGLVKGFNNAIIDSLKVKLQDNGKAEVKEHYIVKNENASPLGDDLVYITPFNGIGFEKNPFVKDERKFPVNFTYPQDLIINLKYKIPEKFQVEELPKNISFSMPENKAKFTVTYQMINDEVVINCKTTIAAIVFLSTDYKALRGFFDEIIKKQNERIVLKRK